MDGHSASWLRNCDSGGGGVGVDCIAVTTFRVSYFSVDHEAPQLLRTDKKYMARCSIIFLPFHAPYVL